MKRTYRKRKNIVEMVSYCTRIERPLLDWLHEICEDTNMPYNAVINEGLHHIKRACDKHGIRMLYHFVEERLKLEKEKKLQDGRRTRWAKKQ